MQQDRRGFFESIGAVIAGLFGAAVGGQAASRVRIEQVRGAPGTLAGFDASGTGQSVTVGTGLTISNGTLSAIPVVASPRAWNVRLVRSATGTYVLPATVASETVVRRNGLGQIAPDDYDIVAGSIVPAQAWTADDIVVADGKAN